ncbi:AMP-binding protein [Streptantibioticus parmotrematis]|uniref:class I adenylate-forming enzyme family protein n=1 Tax=Streptantibioticus parmotrematis TaxID=2873249 RepID=UPI0033E4C6E0
MGKVSRLLAARALERPGSAAFLRGVDGATLTWRGLAAQAERWRRLAAVRDVSERGRVGLVVDDPLAFAAAYLGCLAAGLTAVPMDPRSSSRELGAALSRTAVEVLATDRPGVIPFPSGIDVWDVSAYDGGPRAVAPTRRVRCTGGARPGDGRALRPAVLLTSSGTTGRPKGIPLSEWQLVHAARRVVRHHRLGPTERGYTPLPLFHVNAQVIGVLATLVSGGSLVVDRRFDADAYWERVARWRPTWLNAVPAILTSLAERPGPPDAVAARVRFARSASAPLPPATLAAFEQRTGIGVLETYGMSEAAGQITANPLERAARRAGSVGRPVGIGLTVVTGDGRPAAVGEEGAVMLNGRAVVSRYLDLADSGRESTRPARTGSGWLPTGDVGVRDEEGFLYLAGRADDVINRGGEKIHPLEVENVLLSHPAVASAAVVGAPHPRLGQVPVAFLTARHGAGHEGDARREALIGELRVLCEERLVRYKRPTAINVARTLPLGPTGKVLRRSLRAGLATAGGVV